MPKILCLRCLKYCENWGIFRIRETLGTLRIKLWAKGTGFDDHSRSIKIIDFVNDDTFQWATCGRSDEMCGNP